MVCDTQQMAPIEVRDSVGLMLIMRRVDYATEAIRVIFRRKLLLNVYCRINTFRDVDISLLVFFFLSY